jgi:uncharacterized phage protein (TIGR02220 family)
MVADESRCQVRREAGKLGGNPRLLKQKSTTEDKQIPTPSSSSSSSNNKETREILAYLNERTGRSYQAVPANLKLINARLKEGATVDQCKAVIDAKFATWGPDAKMREYLRPMTLFGAEKFAQYVGEIGPMTTDAAHKVGGVDWE